MSGPCLQNYGGREAEPIRPGAAPSRPTTRRRCRSRPTPGSPSPTTRIASPISIWRRRRSIRRARRVPDHSPVMRIRRCTSQKVRRCVKMSAKTTTDRQLFGCRPFSVPILCQRALANHAKLLIFMPCAGVVQWQNDSFPSCMSWVRFPSPAPTLSSRSGRRFCWRFCNLCSRCVELRDDRLGGG
jgi:hypothetical protein